MIKRSRKAKKDGLPTHDPPDVKLSELSRAWGQRETSTGQVRLGETDLSHIADRFYAGTTTKAGTRTFQICNNADNKNGWLRADVVSRLIYEANGITNTHSDPVIAKLTNLSAYSVSSNGTAAEIIEMMENSFEIDLSIRSLATDEIPFTWDNAAIYAFFERSFDVQ